ncbi:MAG: hypothetical protein JNL83_19205 [Myxococcales bacterium]|nr:hypothetical protein [Myxococcales bacterium]
MSKPTPPTDPAPLPSIDAAALAQVTGGRSDPNGLISALDGLLDSVKQIKATSQANGINPQEMMLFMMLMQRQRESSAVTVAAAPPWWSNGSWYVR